MTTPAPVVCLPPFRSLENLTEPKGPYWTNSDILENFRKLCQRAVMGEEAQLSCHFSRQRDSCAPCVGRKSCLHETRTGRPPAPGA
ncbi:rCG57992 [Rattus norvegicus]|uniref:RCG57992 n=1 Tax=Rattus norvegicus TaxID=10116 RepID=A6J553_RAT|nr:rCG57992 [Rattus norvegicus]